MSYRRRSSNEPALHPDVVLARTLLKIGDNGNSPDSLKREIEDILENLYEYIERDMEHFINLFIPSVCKQPLKSSIYASLVSILRDKYQNFADSLLKITATLFQQAIDTFDNFKIRIIFRFIGELMIVQVINKDSYFNLFKSLFNECSLTTTLHSIEEETTSDRSARSEFFLSIIIDTIPFVGKTLYINKKEEFKDLLKEIDSLIASRSQSGGHSPLLDAFQFDSQDTKEKDPIIEQWNRIVNTYNPQRNGDWETEISNWSSLDSLFYRPSFEDFGLFYSNTPSISFPSISIPSHKKNGIYDRRVLSVFRIFDQQLVEENLPQAGRIILDQYILDLITTFNNSHQECVHNIFSLPFKVKIEHIFLENVLGQLFRLPTAKFRNVYYGVLIVDVCKENSKFPSILSEAISILFNRVDEMNADCFDRFAEWFSFHLSNFLWKWNWSEWISSISNTSSKQYRFICEALENSTRLAYVDRIQRTLPPEFHSLLPAKIEPNYLLADNDLAKLFLQLISKRASIEEIYAFLNENSFENESEKFNFIVEVFLFSAVPSTLHIISKFERYFSFFKSLTEKNENKIRFLQIVNSFWKNSQSHVIIIVDKLMSLKIVDNLSIISWIFSPDMLPFLKSSYVWTIFRNAISRTVRRHETIRSKLDSSNSNENNISIDSSDDPLQSSITSSENELTSLFTLIFTKFSRALDHLETLDDLTKFRINGHLEEFARKNSYHICRILEDESKISSLNARISSLLKEIKYLK